MRSFQPDQSALVGHTGFVGSNLLAGFPFAHLYNSANIEQIAGQSFDLLVFSGAQAKKWWANQNPDEDWAGIQRALDAMAGVKARHAILISTVDVLPDVSGADEESPIEGRPNHAYGTNRWRLEQAFRKLFPDPLIVRLPGLFGSNLRKNVIFDLMTDNNVSQIDPRGTFQYFWLARLWDVLDTAFTRELPLLHVATEPVSTGEIVDRFFQDVPVTPREGTGARYDMRTRHDALFGGSGGYIQSKEQVLADLGTYLAAERGKQ